MYGLADLKPEFRMSNTEIECPVRGCDSTTTRPRRGDNLRSRQFNCQKCGIFISPSTFEYESEQDNILWNELGDSELLSAVKASKAEVHRLTRERSEDAVSWNVVRYFHRSGRICDMLRHLDCGIKVSGIETILWSYSDTQKAPWPSLLDARVKFGETSTLALAALGHQVSEPDVAFVTDVHLIFIEAKFGSDNATSGKPEEVKRRVENPKQYVSGAEGWYEDVFESDYATVVRDQKYELMRFWLLGSWIANRMGRKFLLVNLVRSEFEKEIETEFGQHIKQSSERRFARWTWESLGPLLQRIDDEGARRLHEYMIQKTIGFNEFKKHEVASPLKAFSMTDSGE